MKKFFVLLLALVLGSVVSGQEKPAHGVKNLGWMSGCWEKNGGTKDSFTIEHWTKPAGMMLGASRSVRDGRVEFFEYLRIVETDDGIFYIARPQNAKSETPFKLVSLKDSKAVFENPDHDFPQRLIYKLANEATIDVRVEANKGGKLSGFGFTMKKVSCDQ